MAASTSVHSNALNFMSCLKSGVDPRTGLYNVSINLPEIPGNDLRGPGLGLSLAYSPLNTLDSGYGLGWSLQLSQYNPANQILSLSTGETFKITSSNGDRLLLKEQKLDTFHFYKQDDSHYRVMHKSGIVEILEVLGGSGNRIALPVQIFSVSGHSARLDWQAGSNGQQMLRWVKDDLGQTLLTTERDDANSTVEITLCPYDGPDGGPLACFVMTLSASDKRVSRITLPTENKASWRFEYGFEQDDQLCIQEVHTPTGAHEQILYQDRGHQFPTSSGRKPLPRVTRHIIHPGLEQPDVDVRYTYKDGQQRERNFLGAGLPITWEEDGLDNLYKYLNEYDYVCTESLWVDDKAVRSIERTFNRFHLQTCETTVQNNNVQTVETRYYLEAGKPYDQQPNYCQMPAQITTSWRLQDDATRYRSETVSNTYDSHGNLLVHTRADGIEEISTWYAAGGEEGCPPDPEGFVRHLKDKTIHPALSAQGDAPTLCTRYTYTSLPPLASSSLSDGIVPQCETLVQLPNEPKPGEPAPIEQELQRIRIEHIDLPDEPFQHGRIERQTQTLNDQSTITAYTYSKLDSPQLGVPVQLTTQTLSTDFDNVSRTIVRQHSLLIGQELLSQVEGVEIRYVYDALNRLIRETVAPDSEFEASREYQYTLCASHGETVEQVLINARGAMTRTVLDGLGRPIFEERDHVDEHDPDRVRQTYAACYNAWNMPEKETHYDWLEDHSLALTRQFAYDDWGQQCRVTGDDGVESHQNFDPIGSLEYYGPIQRSWVQSAGASPSISGRSETWLNLFGKADRAMTLDAEEQVLGIRTFLYDGLGRCTQQTDELQHVTQYAYDAWSRMVSITLPDDSVILRDYAPHSSAELPIALNVIKPDGETRTLVGEQEFDGLERLTCIKVGQRTEGFTYDGDRMQVKSRTTAAGDRISFEYNLLLTDQPVSSSAPDEFAEFSYDRTSARLTRARNEQGLRTYDYDALHRLRGENWTDNQGKIWQTLYVSSLQSRQLQRTELKQGTQAGLDTLYHYDALGRVERIEQGNLMASFEYNELSQLSATTTRDLTAGTTLVTVLSYDDQGREILRTLTPDRQPARTLEQVWQIDGLLESRHLQQGTASLLKETFKYDARGRLTIHTCSGSTLPKDADGREITRQVFTFDELDNITLSITTFTGGQTERARFSYANDEPCRLTGVIYTPSRTTPDPSFSYDLNGNQLNDERGQRLTYDSQSRLLNVESPNGQPVSQYRYDSHDHLVTSRQGSDGEILRFYQDQQLSCSVQDDRQNQYLYLQEQPLGQQQPDDAAQTLLLLTDPNCSVLGECQQSDLRTAVYSAYGERHSDDALLGLHGFNGEVRETSSGWYLLGKGYRAYNPVLMRFHSPDSLSPFGAGGVNPYSYCLGNPIALRDPTGHDASGQSGRLRRPDEDAVQGLSGGGGGIMAWVMVAVGVAFTVVGVYATVASFGAAAPVTVPVTAMGITTTAASASAVATGLLATGTALTAASTAASAHAAATGDEESGQWGMYLGLAAMPFSMAGGYVSSVVKAAGQASGTGLVIKSLVDAKTGASLPKFPVQIPRARLAQAQAFVTSGTAPTQRSAVSNIARTSAPPGNASAHSSLMASVIRGTTLKVVTPEIAVTPVAAGSADELAVALATRLAGGKPTQAIAAARASGSKTSAILLKAAERGLVASKSRVGENTNIRQ